MAVDLLAEMPADRVDPDHPRAGVVDELRDLTHVFVEGDGASFVGWHVELVDAVAVCAGRDQPRDDDVVGHVLARDEEHVGGPEVTEFAGGSADEVVFELEL